jgi:hypothetical protein
MKKIILSTLAIMLSFSSIAAEDSNLASYIKSNINNNGATLICNDDNIKSKCVVNFEDGGTYSGVKTLNILQLDEWNKVVTFETQSAQYTVITKELITFTNLIFKK